jgi:HTH-type transcriptional regulator / antitoxin HigA
VNDQEQPFESAGEYITWLLAERKWTQKVLAAVLDTNEPGISRLITNKQPVTAEIALVLESVFGVPAEKFMTLQTAHELANARRTMKPNPEAAKRAQMFAGLPIAEMIRRGWLEAHDVRDPNIEPAIRKFFDIQETGEIAIPAHAAKKTNAGAAATPTQVAWLARARQMAREMITAPYSPFGVRRAIELLRPLTSAAEEARKVPRILAENGIRFVVVETLSHAKIDGACFWLSDAAPVIAMSLRHDRIDNFWFVLRHELEHVLQGHGKDQVIIDAELEGERAGTGIDVAEEERVANTAASEFAVPKKTMDSFIARKAPFFAERDILGVARTLKVHPGLVAGQLQNRTGRYDRFRDHLVKIRSIVAVSALVDGWGNVAPVGPR